MASRNESSDESLVTPDETGMDDAGREHLAPAVGHDAPAEGTDVAPGPASVRAVTEQARQARPARRGSGDAHVAGKGVTTPGRGSRQRVARQRGTTPAQFAGESVDELKKVVWPTGLEVRRYFAAVLVFVLVLILFVGLLDLLFGWALLRLFG